MQANFVATKKVTRNSAKKYASNILPSARQVSDR